MNSATTTSCRPGRPTTSPGSGTRCGTTSTSVPRRAAETVLGSRDMPGAQWFPGATLNYAVEAFRHETDKHPALVVVGEDGATEWSWARLRSETAAFANYLRRLGVTPGDRVVGYLPNVGEAVAAFLGAASVGATWAVCNPDLAVDGVIARLGQLEPAVLVASDGSVYGGKRIDRSKELAAIRGRLPTLRRRCWYPGWVRCPPPRTSRRGRRSSNSTHRWRSLRCRSTTRCGCCSRRERQAPPRASCTATGASCSNT